MVDQVIRDYRRKLPLLQIIHVESCLQLYCIAVILTGLGVEEKYDKRFTFFLAHDSEPIVY